MKIDAIIFHKIISSKHQSQVEVVTRDEEIALPDSRADNLVKSVLDSYKKDKLPAYAGFDEKEWFPNELCKLIDGLTTFYDFSVAGLDIIKQKMVRVPASTGGYFNVHILLRR